MNASFFQMNRDKLAHATEDGCIVLSAYTQMQRGNDAAFAFEQEANFWWLTGIEAPDWQVIIDSTHRKSWLVMPMVSDTHQIFDGSLSAKQAQSISGIQDVISAEQAQILLLEEAKKHRIVHTLGEHTSASHYDFTVNPAQHTLHSSLERQFKDVQDCRSALAKLRAIKQPEEIRAIKKAIKITNAAFTGVKAKLDTLSYEYEVEAEFTYAFRRSGAKGHAYDPIVAAGKNACTLHYNDNNAQLKNGTLLLLDIGARVDGYAADVTRTYSVDVPTSRQMQVHDAVKRAHTTIIELLKPGLNVKQYHQQVDEIMKSVVDQLGLLKQPEDYRKYFPHSISHGLGIDVHDSLGSPETLQPGMILTVEPGIYIPEEAIGVRIEDDILITSTGYENLSASLSTDL
jgi:Xaa-Pro aminopeptidase